MRSAERRQVAARFLLPGFLLFWTAAVAHGQEESQESVFRVLAQAGDAVTNRAGEEVVPLLSRDVIAIDRRGRALFDGATRPAGGGANVVFDALFIADGTAVRSVFAAGDAAPTDGIAASGTTIVSIDDDELSLSPDGDVLAKVELTGGALFSEALLTERDGTAGVAVALAVPFDNLCGLGDIGNGAFTRQFALNGDALVFHGRRAMTLCGDDLTGVFRSVGGLAEILAIEDEDVPGRAGQTFDGFFLGPALAPDGTYVFTGRYRDTDTAENVTVLLRAPPENGLAVISATGASVPGTTLAVTSFGAPTTGPAPTPGADPRVVYLAAASNGEPSQSPAYASGLFVFDASQGSAPLIGTGTEDTFGDFTFAPRQVAYAIAGASTTVVLGETTGPDVPENGVGVWRHDPQAAAPLQVVLHENGPVPGNDPRADGRSITRILTVALNEAGRLAVECELSTVGQAVLLEEPNANGRFRIAAQLGDMLPTRDVDGRLFGILSQLPNFPRITGTGENGYSSRFNADGEFVFRARIDPDDGSSDLTSLYAVALGVTSEDDCDVEVKQKGRNLIVRGGEDGCNVTVRSAANGAFEVIPGDGTTVNGEDTSASYTGVTGSVRVTMGGGDDRLTLDSTAPAATKDGEFDVRRNLIVDTGDGSDSLTMSRMVIDGSFTLRTGSAGTEQVSASDVDVARNLKVMGGALAVDADLTGFAVEGRATLTLPGGPAETSTPSPVELRACGFGKLTVKGSRFSDDVRFDGCDFSGAVKIDTKGGLVEEVRFAKCTLEGGLRIKARKSGFLKSRITETTVAPGSLRIDTGTTGCEVTLIRCTVDGDLLLKTRSPASGDIFNKLVLQNSFFESALVLKGGGPHDFELSSGSSVARGLTINTKGGALDVLHVTDTLVDEGNVFVKTRAENAEILLSELRVTTGSAFVRTTKGVDMVTVRTCDFDGTLQVTLDDGDDALAIDGTTVGGNRRLFGGSGTDTFDDGGEVANTTGGESVELDFESGPAKIR